MNTSTILTLSILCSAPIFADHSPNSYVRLGTDLCPQELEFLDKRADHAKNALESLLNKDLSDHPVPRIGLCLSGGGYRAMLASLGFLQGLMEPQKKVAKKSITISHSWLQLLARYIMRWFCGSSSLVLSTLPSITDEPSLFDTFTYCSCLSGSSWAVAGWLQSRKPLDQYLDHVITHIGEHLFARCSVATILVPLLKKYSQEQPISLVDVYGILLAQTLLSDLGAENPQDFLIPGDRDYLHDAIIPFPIHAAIIGDHTSTYEWVEFSPYEVGSVFLKSFIPTESFGRYFEKGVSHDYLPAQSLGFCMGLWGSGMCLNAKEFLDLIQPHVHSLSLAVQQQLDTILILLMGNRSLSTIRLSPARVHNWNYKLRSVPLAQHETLSLVDAGIDFRIALPALLRAERACDIIIVLDTSDRPIGTELQEAELYAQRHALKFPPIDYLQVTHPISVHQHPTDMSCPTIIYVPLIKNSIYDPTFDPREATFTSTFNFKYSQQEASLLTGLTRHAAFEYQQDILRIIQTWIDARKIRAKK